MKQHPYPAIWFLPKLSCSHTSTYKRGQPIRLEHAYVTSIGCAKTCPSYSLSVVRIPSCVWPSDSPYTVDHPTPFVSKRNLQNKRSESKPVHPSNCPTMESDGMVPGDPGRQYLRSRRKRPRYRRLDPSQPFQSAFSSAPRTAAPATIVATNSSI